MKRPVVLMLLLLVWPGIAAAVDGLLTLVVGIPLLLCLSVVLALMLPLRSRKPVRIASIVLSLPVLACVIYIAFDAGTLFGEMGSENSMIGLAFFGLMLVAGLLFHAVMRGRDRPRGKELQ